MALLTANIAAQADLQDEPLVDNAIDNIDDKIDDLVSDIEEDVSDLEDQASIPNDAVTFESKKENAGEPSYELNDWKNWEDADWWIAGSSMIGTVWWILWGWFVYINSANENSGIIPITWFWSNTNNATLGYTAIGFLFHFWFYLIVSVAELMLWMWYYFGDQTDNCGIESGFWWFNFWASYFGLYGSWILYGLCVLMWVLQLW